MQIASAKKKFGCNTIQGAVAEFVRREKANLIILIILLTTITVILTNKHEPQIADTPEPHSILWKQK